MSVPSFLIEFTLIKEMKHVRENHELCLKERNTPLVKCFCCKIKKENNTCRKRYDVFLKKNVTQNTLGT